MAKKLTCVLYNDYDYSLEEYENYYKEELEIEEITDKNKFYEWLYDTFNMDIQDLFVNLEHSKYNQPCVVLGSVGTWRGRFDIENTKYDTLVDALKDCLNGADFSKIILTNGKIEVIGIHHDGTNCFDIVLLNELGQKTIKGDLSNRRYHKKIDDYLF
jgi:hypothetical protein